MDAKDKSVDFREPNPNLEHASSHDNRKLECTERIVAAHYSIVMSQGEHDFCSSAANARQRRHPHFSELRVHIAGTRDVSNLVFLGVRADCPYGRSLVGGKCN